jgi:hypothetical protein
MVEWLLPGGGILRSLPERLADKKAPELPTAKARLWVKPYVPVGVVGWRVPPEADWRPMSELPKGAWGLGRPGYAGLPYDEEEEV